MVCRHHLATVLGVSCFPEQPTLGTPHGHVYAQVVFLDNAAVSSACQQSSRFMLPTLSIMQVLNAQSPNFVKIIIIPVRQISRIT